MFNLSFTSLMVTTKEPFDSQRYCIIIYFLVSCFLTSHYFLIFYYKFRNIGIMHDDEIYIYTMSCIFVFRVVLSLFVNTDNSR